jgi:hypothetical protein
VITGSGGGGKHSFEKVGDRWQPKKGKGPSDPQKGGKTFGGLDVLGNTRKTLYERAKGLGTKGRSSMSTEELGEPSPASSKGFGPAAGGTI